MASASLFSRLILRRMEPADISAVVEVERSAFGHNWPATAFERELTQNRMARYVVLDTGSEIAGFGGIWLMVDEAHVVTVAVPPRYRRHGLGRLIVHGLVQLAQCEGMLDATLECRVSNTAARALYARYGFYEVGLRPRYYQDTQEDAVVMTTEPLASEPYQRRLQRLEEELAVMLPGVSNRVAGCCVPAAGRG
ncbi:MAG: ribosomal-protein-alanine N-acetyltransferase [Anaerolinea sp.]|nr:ribosomal-protein-alanine N-acetyltransferase [Anaerolinea sp.]